MLLARRGQHISIRQLDLTHNSRHRWRALCLRYGIPRYIIVRSDVGASARAQMTTTAPPHAADICLSAEDVVRANESAVLCEQ